MTIITFPEHEVEGLKERLRQHKVIFTTRCRRERGWYKKGEELDSFQLGILKVEDVVTYQSLSDHPFFEYLTDEEKKLLSTPFDVVKLSWVRNKEGWKSC